MIEQSTDSPSRAASTTAFRLATSRRLYRLAPVAGDDGAPRGRPVLVGEVRLRDPTLFVHARSTAFRGRSRLDPQATIGLVLATRRPANVVWWTFGLFGSLLAVGVFGCGYLAFGLGAAGAVSFAPESIAWMESWLVVPGLTLIAVVTGCTFPHGSLLSARWSWVLVVGALGAALAALGSAAAPGPLVFYPTIDNPPPGRWQVALAPAVRLVGWAVTGAGALLAGLSLAIRLRKGAASGTPHVRELLDDSTFVSALDARIRAVVGERSTGGPDEDPGSPGA